MKRSLLCLLTAVACVTSSLCAADDAQTLALRAADDARVAAMKAADESKLKELLSEDLHYAHSSGTVDNKTVLINALVSGKSKYTAYDYVERNFTSPAPGIALMTGRTHLQVTSAKGTMDSVLSFLAVWREEKGQWRFLAWQSCKIPPAAPAAK
jgi:hypothetical protein